MIKPAKMPIPKSQQREIDGYLLCLKAEFSYRDWFIMKKESVNKIAAAVQEGGFYTILGPPRSQKSFLLGAIKEKLQNKSDHFCVFLDLFKVDSKTDESFFKSFGELFASKMDKPGRDNTHPAFYDINSENSLFLYLQKLLAFIEKNLVILIDHSERIRITPLKSLLNILSKLYNGNQVREREGRHISVVTTNSFRTASLVLDADFSFKFSIIEKMGDLSDEAMNIFMDFISSVTEIEIEKDARILCSQYTSGDPYLMSMLCDRAIEKILELNYFPSRTDIDETNAGVPLPDVVGEREMTEEINWFFREEAIEHRPLHEIIESIECDPLILIDFLELLKNSGKLPVQNRHKIGVNIDKMELTGAVRIIDSGGQKMYEFRNSLYRCCLNKHFYPKHVVDVLTTAGMWNKAIEHLKHQIESDDGAVNCYDPCIRRCDNAIRDYGVQLFTKPNHRPMLMQTVVNYIYAVDSIHDACNVMINALEIAFKRSDYRIYILNPDRSMLKLFSCSEACKAAPEKIPLKGERGDSPEARACCNKNYYLDENGIFHIPLIDKKDKKQKLLGVTVLHNFHFKPQNSDSKLLLSFLNQASAALGNVIERETRLQQLEELNTLGKEISRGHLTEDQIFEETAVKISQVYGTVGASVHLLSQINDPEKCLKQETESSYCYGALAGNVLEIQPRPRGLTYQVLKSRRPCRLENPEQAPGLNQGLLALGVRACMCIPMISRETIYGVFFVHYNENHSFSQNEIEILTLFANQATAAFENTRLINQLKALNIISSDMVKGLKLDALLDSMAEYVVKLLGARKSIFLLFDEQYIYKKRVCNYPKEHIKQISHKQVMEGLSGEVYRTKKEIICEDARYHEKNTESARKKAIKLETGPIIVAPIKIKEKVIGTLTAANQVGDRVFTNNDLELTCMLANQAAIAIDNANLFNETKDIIDFLSHRLKTDMVGPYALIRKAMQSETSLTKKELEKISDKLFAAKTTIDDLSQSSITESDNLMSRANFSPQYIKDVIDSSIKSVFYIKTDRVKQDIQVNPRVSIVENSLKHAILNILDNARLYSEPNSIIEIIVYKSKEDKLKTEPSRLMIKIMSQPDKSVDHNEIPDFFKKGFRGKNVGNTDGTGLGLFIANRVLKMHKGELKVEPLDDKYIAFTLILPLQ